MDHGIILVFCDMCYLAITNVWLMYVYFSQNTNVLDPELCYLFVYIKLLWLVCVHASFIEVGSAFCTCSDKLC